MSYRKQRQSRKDRQSPPQTSRNATTTTMTKKTIEGTQNINAE